MSALAKAIHEAKAEQRCSLDDLRRRARLSNDAFYALVKGRPPKTIRTLRKLKRAGVRIPEGLVS